MGSIPPDSRPDFMTQVRHTRQGRAHRAAHRPRLGGARARPFRPRPRDRVAVRHDCRDALCLCEHGRAGSGPAGVRSANARRLSWHDERICLQACHRADERVGSSAQCVVVVVARASLKSYEAALDSSVWPVQSVFKVALCMCTVLLSCRSRRHK